MKKNKEFIRGSDGGKKTLELYGREHMRKLAIKMHRKNKHKIKCLKGNKK